MLSPKLSPDLFHPQLLSEQVALITGGRSGIGYHTAELFCRLGAQVVIASRDEEKLIQARDQLREVSPLTQVEAFSCDIRESEAISQLADYIESRFSRLDILVNNAGGQFPSLAENLSDRGWNAVINNNLNGTFFVTREMGRRFFLSQGGGVVVNVIAGIMRGFPGMAHTGAARAGVENLTKTLAQEWAREGVRLNCVAPGIIASSGLDTYPKPIREVLDQATESIPFGRLGESAEVANAICFLASELSSYISGTTLYVDGAQHLNYDNLGLVNAIKKMMSAQS